MLTSGQFKLKTMIIKFFFIKTSSLINSFLIGEWLSGSFLIKNYELRLATHSDSLIFATQCRRTVLDQIILA